VVWTYYVRNTGLACQTLLVYGAAAFPVIQATEPVVLVCVLYSRHRGAIIGAIATLALGALVGPIWASTETQRREKIESTRLRHDREEKVMTQFAEFRAALTQLATDCVPRPSRTNPCLSDTWETIVTFRCDRTTRCGVVQT
jgi:hypothetical protein